MTPGARLAAAIEILTEIFARAAAADRVLTSWGRTHRFAGSKDRAAIADRVYTVLRRRNECAYRMDDDSPRALVIGSLAVEGLTSAAVDPLLQDGPHAPGALTQVERAALEHTLPPPAEPWVRLNYPQWLDHELQQAFGARLETEVRALNGRAPLDLRVNSLKAKRDHVLAELARDGVNAAPCRYAPMGLRVASGLDAKVAKLDAYQSGRVEIQDEASQIAVLLAGAKAGDIAIDLAAGAGGKSLALAATMRNEGRVLACDVDAARLTPLAERAARAGAKIIEAAGDPYSLARPGNGADVVFVDAPCSSSGTWRRNPEAKWTLTPARLDEHRAAQRQLLDRANELCASNGRIVFATCSVLPSEGPVQVEAFLERHRGWSVKHATDIWTASTNVAPPTGLGRFGALSPAQDGTDGFFVAVLGRISP
ncbi:MAG: MFS transporter [Alphaproteobacteria bacterium]|nr:MFS transporter [Alphaproteobacteria bacterium]